MAVMAAACGILIVLLGVWSMRGSTDGVQGLTAVVCLVGGLNLCFMATVLSRVAALVRRLEAAEPPADAPEQQP